MKREVIKSFNLEAYKKGAKVQTRGGAEVRIICTDAKNQKYPIIALIELRGGSENTIWYTSEGKRYFNGELDPLDLVIVEEQEFWSDNENKDADGYFIGFESDIIHSYTIQYTKDKYKYFASKKQAKSALAMAMISQIMTNDVENFGGVITDEEWKNENWKYHIYRYGNGVHTAFTTHEYHFLAFHTKEQRDLFLEKYRDLIKDYLMID